MSEPLLSKIRGTDASLAAVGLITGTVSRAVKGTVRIHRTKDGLCLGADRVGWSELITLLKMAPISNV